MTMDLSVHGAGVNWFVMCGRNVYGRYESRASADQAAAQSTLPRQAAVAKESAPLRTWENEGGSVNPLRSSLRQRVGF
jgi:hypothetical protein